jgi:hypothetical protein
MPQTAIRIQGVQTFSCDIIRLRIKILEIITLCLIVSLSLSVDFLRCHKDAIEGI